MHADLNTLSAKLRTAVTDLSVRQTQSAPLHRPEKWSIQQIVEHLLLTYRSTSDALEARLKKTRPTRTVVTVPHLLAQCIVITLGHFPRGRKAPEMVDPSMPSILLSGLELSDRLAFELTRMDTLIRQLEARFGKMRAMNHMALGPMSADQWRRFHLVHGLHHLRQISSIRKDHAF